MRAYRPTRLALVGHRFGRLTVVAEVEPDRRSTTIVAVDGELLPAAVASRRHGFNGNLVSSRMRKGWPANRLFEAARKPKLTNHDRADIFAMFAIGASKLGIAQAFDVSHTSIRRVLSVRREDERRGNR